MSRIRSAYGRWVGQLGAHTLFHRKHEPCVDAIFFQLSGCRAKLAALSAITPRQDGTRPSYCSEYHGE